MFNTLLRQLRLSIDYALTGSYDGALSLGTKIIKEHEERMFQEAVIKTIGGKGRGAGPGGGAGPGLEGRGGAGGAGPCPGEELAGKTRLPGDITCSYHVIPGHWGNKVRHGVYGLAQAGPE